MSGILFGILTRLVDINFQINKLYLRMAKTKLSRVVLRLDQPGGPLYVKDWEYSQGHFTFSTTDDPLRAKDVTDMDFEKWFPTAQVVVLWIEYKELLLKTPPKNPFERYKIS
jgi:hypothetical protein